MNRHTGAHVKALLAVHVFGNMANMPGLVELCRKYGLVLIEDSTEALGTYYTEGPYRGKMAGTIGDIGVYSFNGNKIITTGAAAWWCPTTRTGWSGEASFHPGESGRAAIRA